MFVCIRWTGRGRPAADACTGAKVQNSTDGARSARERERKKKRPPSAIGGPPADDTPPPPPPPHASPPSA